MLLEMNCIYTTDFKLVILYTIKSMVLAMSRRCTTTKFQPTFRLTRLLCVMSSSLSLTVELQKGSSIYCLHLNHSSVVIIVKLPSGDMLCMEYFIFKYSILH